MSINAFSFGKATELMKQGKRVARRGWNGSDMFAFYVPAGKGKPPAEVIENMFPSNVIPYRAYFALKTAQNDIATWTPSTSDTLATDWYMVTEEEAREMCKHKYLINQ